MGKNKKRRNKVNGTEASAASDQPDGAKGIEFKSEMTDDIETVKVDTTTEDGRIGEETELVTLQNPEKRAS